LFDPDLVSDPDGARFEDADRDAAVAADGVIAAGTEGLFHPRAGVTLPRAFEQRFADAESAILERQQVDAGDDEVSSEHRRLNGFAAEERGDHGKMLGLDQRDLALAAAGRRVVVVVEAGANADRGFGDLNDLAAAGRREADPFEAAGAREGVEEFLDRGHGVIIRQRESAAQARRDFSMTITLELPDELERGLSAEAARHGVPLAEYAVQLLTTAVPPMPPITDGASLVAYWEREGLIGSRPDIEDSQLEARRIRERAERRTRE